MAVQRIALCALACVTCTTALAGPAAKPRPATVRQAAAASTEQEPLLLRAARGEKVERTPVWMMRQAGRHMKVYRDLVAKYLSVNEKRRREAKGWNAGGSSAGLWDPTGYGVRPGWG